MTPVSNQTVLKNVAMACSTKTGKTSSKHAKTLVILGQRHLNTTRNATGPKKGAEGLQKIFS